MSKKTVAELMDVFRNATGILIDPELPANFHNLPHSERPSCHQHAWGKPYIRTQQRFDGIDEAKWLEDWPSGTRYDVYCLDGGAHDRPTALMSFDNLDEASRFAAKVSKS